MSVGFLEGILRDEDAFARERDATEGSKIEAVNLILVDIRQSVASTLQLVKGSRRNDPDVVCAMLRKNCVLFKGFISECETAETSNLPYCICVLNHIRQFAQRINNLRNVIGESLAVTSLEKSYSEIADSAGEMIEKISTRRTKRAAETPPLLPRLLPKLPEANVESGSEYRMKVSPFSRLRTPSRFADLEVPPDDQYEEIRAKPSETLPQKATKSGSLSSASGISLSMAEDESLPAKKNSADAEGGRRCEQCKALCSLATLLYCKSCRMEMCLTCDTNVHKQFLKRGHKRNSALSVGASVSSSQLAAMVEIDEELNAIVNSDYSSRELGTVLVAFNREKRIKFGKKIVNGALQWYEKQLGKQQKRLADSSVKLDGFKHKYKCKLPIAAIREAFVAEAGHNQKAYRRSIQLFVDAVKELKLRYEELSPDETLALLDRCRFDKLVRGEMSEDVSVDINQREVDVFLDEVDSANDDVNLLDSLAREGPQNFDARLRAMVAEYELPVNCASQVLQLMRTRRMDRDIVVAACRKVLENPQVAVDQIMARIFTCVNCRCRLDMSEVHKSLE